MIQFRKDHPVISRKLPNAVCGMESIHTHNINARDVTIPRDAHTFAVSFAGYDKSKSADDLIYIVINAYWEDVTVTLPELARLVHGISVSTHLGTEMAVISMKKARSHVLSTISACGPDPLPSLPVVIIKIHIRDKIFFVLVRKKWSILNGIKKQNFVQFRRTCGNR